MGVYGCYLAGTTWFNLARSASALRLETRSYIDLTLRKDIIKLIRLHDSSTKFCSQYLGRQLNSFFPHNSLEEGKKNPETSYRIRTQQVAKTSN